MKAWTENMARLEIYRAESGWVVRRGYNHPAHAPQDVAGIADDQGLVEWFAEQLASPAPDLLTRPPNPGSEAKPAEHGAPPVAAEADELVEVLVESANRASARSAENWSIVLAIREALKPFVKLTLARRANADEDLSDIKFDDTAGEVGQVLVGDLRALIHAAGLWTDEMQAPAEDPGPAGKPEAAAPPPPADGLADDVAKAEAGLALNDKPVEQFKVDDDFPL